MNVRYTPHGKFTFPWTYISRITRRMTPRSHLQNKQSLLKDINVKIFFTDGLE